VVRQAVSRLEFLKSIPGYLLMAGVIIGMAWFLIEVLHQQEVLREITPDAGMTKHCVQNAEGVLVCSQAPVAPTAPAGPRDPNAPLFVTVAPE
jgi:hypothetical protein